MANPQPMTEEECNRVASQQMGFAITRPNESSNQTRHIQNSGQRDRHVASTPRPLYSTTQRGK